ncbi:ABC transporter [Clostridium carboxidivorans P7]|uniref:ABC transporter related protein n=1 Tax=Clostridium carboxidivorans P7 TaxID=536227 RepID=C6Q1S7_9CLOT|nr:ABC transporter ATP-binding protein [Clostridium carboxidivorans]AKN32902.1 ABC transporter [Clostridium carboxidivorans P7]EET84544.1 ABC transporter related protein [Clostridium carboxidivorans P7]EFG89844.1 putative ATP synthase F0, A subunit [Clostridium carboxidivorans P7]
MIINPFNKNDIKLIIHSFRYLTFYKLKFVITFICMIIGIVFGLIQPIIWAKLLKSLFSKDFSQIVSLVIYISIIFIVSATTTLVQNYLIAFINNNIIYDIKKDMYASALNLSMKAFDEMNVGDFISRIHNDSATIANVLTNQILTSIVDILKVITIGIALLFISPLLSLVVILCFPISYLIFVHYGESLKEKNSQLVESNDKYFNELHQSLVGIREINSLNVKPKKIRLFSILSEDVRNKTISLGFINTLSQILAQSANVLSQILVTLIGAFMVINSNLSMVYFITFTSYSTQFSSSLLNITKINSNFQQILKSLERVFDLIDNLSYSKQKFGTKHLNNINGTICFKNVYFEYKKNSPILNDVSFNIPVHKVTAIVGTSGAGKSTILSLILKFYSPSKGCIELDDVNINDLDEQTLRSNISIVHQEPYLFNSSIKENLLIANPTATNKEIEDACSKAYIYDFIESLPEKYDTLIGENGVNLSGGQKQRLAIARALLKRSKIILFDEATASLDNQSQEYVNKSIKFISSHCTIVIVAHRLSSLMFADKIIIINKGKVVGQGPHDKLINENITYKNLYNIEAS